MIEHKCKLTADLIDKSDPDQKIDRMKYMDCSCSSDDGACQLTATHEVVEIIEREEIA